MVKPEEVFITPGMKGGDPGKFQIKFQCKFFWNVQGTDVETKYNGEKK